MERAIGIITTNYAVANASPLTATRPPASVPVAGRYRAVDFILSCMVDADIRTIGMILPVHYRSLVDHISRFKDWSLDKKQGGLFFLPGSAFGSTRTGGRFLIRDLIDNRVILDKADEKYVVLAAANIIMNINLNQLIAEHVASGADITMAVQDVVRDNNALMACTIEEDRITGFRMGCTMGQIASLDCCVMSIDMLNSLLRWYSANDYMDLFQALIPDLNRVKVYPYFYEGKAMSLFSLKAYYDNSMSFLDTDTYSQIFLDERPILTKAHDLPPAKYEPGSKVRHSLVSGGCQIAGTVEDSILSRTVVVEPGAVVKRKENMR